jgi:cytochrome c biogenesis protein CcdA
MESAGLGIGAALLMGLSFGAGPCNITCLPYLGPVLLRADNSWQVVLPFSLGRLFSYTMVGAVAGGLGGLSRDYFEGELGAVMLGLATVAMGLLMMARSRASRCCPAPVDVANRTEQTLTYVAQNPNSFALFAMGSGMALNPCAPLATVLMTAALTGSAVQGLSLGLAFGMGAVIVPTLLFVYLVSQLGQQVRAHLSEWRRGMELGAGGLLITLGIATLLGWVKL